MSQTMSGLPVSLSCAEVSQQYMVGTSTLLKCSLITNHIYSARMKCAQFLSESVKNLHLVTVWSVQFVQDLLWVEKIRAFQSQ